MTSTFVGRQAELERLIETTHKRTASFIVVRGRRRIGKSRLIQEFAKEFSHYYAFVGLPPGKDTTAKSQLDEFSRQLARQFHRDPVQYQDWSDALWILGERVQTGKVLLLFDEISWMGSKDPSFLGKIKNAWDQQPRITITSFLWRAAPPPHGLRRTFSAAPALSDAYPSH